MERRTTRGGAEAGGTAPPLHPDRPSSDPKHSLRVAVYFVLDFDSSGAIDETNLLGRLARQCARLVREGAFNPPKRARHQLTKVGVGCERVRESEPEPAEE